MAGDREFGGPPDRVIMVDPDDPMREIRARFVWLEEHDRVVAAVRREAFAEGYAAAQAQAAETAPRIAPSPAPRRSLLDRARLLVLSLGALVVLLMLPVVVFGR